MGNVGKLKTLCSSELPWGQLREYKEDVKVVVSSSEMLSTVLHVGSSGASTLYKLCLSPSFRKSPTSTQEKQTFGKMLRTLHFLPEDSFVNDLVLNNDFTIVA